MASDKTPTSLRDLVHDLKNALVAIDIHINLAQGAEGQEQAQLLIDARTALKEAKEQLDGLLGRGPRRLPGPKLSREYRRGLQILVMDDDPRIRRTMERLLTHLGHEATCAAHGDANRFKPTWKPWSPGPMT